MFYTFMAKISPQCYPETRATQSILILVKVFFPFNSPSSLFTFSMTYFDEHGWWLVNTSTLIAAHFPTLEPLRAHQHRQPCLQAVLYLLHKTISVNWSGHYAH